MAPATRCSLSVFADFKHFSERSECSGPPLPSATRLCCSSVSRVIRRSIQEPPLPFCSLIPAAVRPIEQPVGIFIGSRYPLQHFEWHSPGFAHSVGVFRASATLCNVIIIQGNENKGPVGVSRVSATLHNSVPSIHLTPQPLIS